MYISLAYIVGIHMLEWLRKLCKKIRPSCRYSTWEVDWKVMMVAYIHIDIHTSTDLE